MKKWGTYMVISLLIFAGITCKKEPPIQPGVSNTGTAVFSFNGTIGTTPISYTAGANSYYMYSYYTQAANGLYSFIGSLHQTNTSVNGPNSIQFIINDYRVLTLNAAEPNIADSSLKIAPYPYVDSAGVIIKPTTAFSVRYAAISDSLNAVTSYLWHFGDSGTSTLANPTHKFTQAGLYKTTLQIVYAHGRVANAYDTVGQIMHTAMSATPNDAADSNFIFSAVPTGGIGPYTYKWNFGRHANDTASGPSPTPHISYDTMSNKIQATLITTDANNHSSFTTRNFDCGSDHSNYANFTFSAPIPDTATTSLPFSSTTIVYTDASGDVYSSANVATQPGSSNFKITGVSSYQNNENGQTTQKLNVTFSCQLMDLHHKILNISNSTATIAVAYK